MKTWQKLKQNPQLFDRYFVKEYMIKSIRKFFEDRNYHELESPILTSKLPQERYLDVLETSIDLSSGEQKTAYLIPSTETFNKKILVAGIGNHFVITKVFRGLEEIGPNHSPEFTMLEWYEIGNTYFDLMNSCEELFREIKKFVDIRMKKDVNLEIDYQGQKIDLSGQWDRISVYEALKKINIELSDIQNINDFRAIAKKKGYTVDEKDDWQTIFELIFANEIESTFSKSKPTFVYDYPKQLCPLTKLNDSNPLVAQKVEVYIAGKEIGNGYTELLDWKEQENRFLEEKDAREKLGKKPVNFDVDLVNALREGMPSVAGIGIGLDRLAMIFANAKSISDINFFPASEMFE